MKLLGNAQPSQEDNEVGGHLAGRDVHDVRKVGQLAGRDINNNKFQIDEVKLSVGARTHMQTLIARLKAETDADPDLKKTVELLRNYTLRRGPAIGLKTKLTLAFWAEDDITWAMTLKEQFAKRLTSHEFSEAAQHILAHLLAKVCNTFKAKIRPLIAKNAPQEQVQAAVFTEVIEPALHDLEENPLIIQLDEILGALYFLTGNCHIRWDTE